MNQSTESTREAKGLKRSVAAGLVVALVIGAVAGGAAFGASAVEADPAAVYIQPVPGEGAGDDVIPPMPGEGAKVTVAFNDVALKECVAEALRVSVDSDINEEEMATIQALYCGDRGIVDIAPLAAATGMNFLDVGHNEIANVTALSGLTNLAEVWLNHNEITDFSPISGLTGLTSLDISGSGLTDLSAVAKLTNLTELHAYANNITDLGAISGLTKLTELDVGHNNVDRPIPDLSDPSFDLAPLAGLTNLTDLDVGGNGLTDISVVAKLTNLTSVEVGINAISDLTAVSDLTGLTYLGADSQQIFLAEVRAGTTQALPRVASVGGKEIKVTLAEDSPAAATIADGSITWVESGHLEWATDVTVGGATGVFSGVFNQGVSPTPPADPADLDRRDDVTPPVEVLPPAKPFEAQTSAEIESNPAAGLSLLMILAGLAAVGGAFARRRMEAAN